MAYQLNINWPEFLEKYWQKQPVVLKNAFPDFVDPITPDELAGLAMEPEVDSRLVSLKNGKWQASNGPFEHFDGLGETGWSLLAQAVNHWHMPAAELVRPFRVLPDWRLDDLMISFSVPGGGVGPHIDQYDVFIIQGMGSRRWRVGDKLPMRQFCPHPALLHVDPFPPIIDEDLQPGRKTSSSGSAVSSPPRVTSWILRRRNHRMKKRKWSMRCWVVKSFPA
ncbi:MAG: cupin domain-containing protein [Veillonella sp.]|nr:cupin domain-containing protein [Veillonella sp.]